ncbi:MAG: hypothetical protein KGL54_04390 [Sphingomonadales bacterium]|nr:hypothetical protein [Sphingomonadales bacterium]
MVAQFIAVIATFIGVSLALIAAAGWFPLMQNEKTSVVASAFGLFTVARLAPFEHDAGWQAFLVAVAVTLTGSAVHQFKSSCATQ